MSASVRSGAARLGGLVETCACISRARTLMASNLVSGRGSEKPLAVPLLQAGQAQVKK